MSLSIVAPITEKASRPWYTQLWPWLLMLGPLVVIVGGGFTMWLAFERQDALVVGDYYKEGMAINQDLRRDRVAARLGLSTKLRYDAVQGKLIGRIAGRGGIPHTDKFTVRLVHSTMPDKDIMLNVESDAGGNFTAFLPMLEMARWQVMLEDNARQWRLNGVWVWPREHEAVLEAGSVGQQ